MKWQTAGLGVCWLLAQACAKNSADDASTASTLGEEAGGSEASGSEASGSEASGSEPATGEGGQIDPESCELLTSEVDCTSAQIVGGEGACYWVDSIVVQAEAACDTAVPTPLCVGIQGTQQGCGITACPDPASEINAYVRTTPAGLQVFANPECGPEPAGDWSSCADSNDPACACICD